MGPWLPAFPRRSSRFALSAPQSRPGGPMTLPYETEIPTGTPEEVSAQAGRKIQGRSPWILAWLRLRRDRVAMISLGVIAIVVLAAIFAPVFASITGHPPNEQFRETGLTEDGLPKGPTGEFVLGTDDLGRDILVRMIDIVLSVPFLLVAIALVSVTGPSLTIAILVIGFFSWASVARIVRGQVLSLREGEFGR